MKKYRFLLAALTVMALLLFAASPVVAQHAAKGNSQKSGDEGGATALGQQAAVDPATGKLRQPTAQEMKELLQGLAPMLNQSVEGLQLIHLPDGTVGVDLQDRFQNATIAKINPDGTASQECVSTVQEAEAFLRNEKSAASAKTAVKPKSTPKPLEEK